MIATVVLFIWGAVIGSFMNAFLFRYNVGKTLGGRSGCMSCGKELGASELVPILSYLLLRGKCRGCKSKISIQYPLVEALSGVVFVCTNAAVADSLQFIFVTAFFLMLLCIAVYDLHHTIIPDPFVAGAGVLALASQFASGANLAGLLVVLAGSLLLAAPLFFIWFFSRGKAMGLGDAKLMFVVGIFLSPLVGMVAFLFSFWMGALFGVLLLLLTKGLPRAKRVTMKSEVPFGPFIVAATALVYFLHVSPQLLLAFFA